MIEKNQLLERYSPSQIYSFFYEGYTTKKNVSSPFSEDKNPSLRFYKNGTFKCFSSGKQGDVFQFVAEINALNCKSEFAKVLEIIKERVNFVQVVTDSSTKKNNIEKEEATHSIDFFYKTKDFERIHLDYFKKGNWNITEKILSEYNVFALDKFHFWNEQKQDVTKIKLFNNVLGFVYKVNENVELYVPRQNNKVKKFFYNRLKPEDIFGVKQLSRYSKIDSLIICAGKKDCLILNANNFPAICFRSENHYVTKEQIKQLQTYSEKIFVCYDNDSPGIKAAKAIADKYNLLRVVLPDNYNDVADFFEEKEDIDFKELIQNADDFHVPKDKKRKKEKTAKHKQTIFHIVENYLYENYEFRFNTVLLDIESKPKKKQEQWKICNEDSLFIELQKKGINIQMNKLISILKSDFVPTFNPIRNYFKDLKKWNGKDYVSELVKYITTPNPKDFTYHLKKWLARSVKCMLIDGYFNKQAFIITDKGTGQNIGKSYLTKWLCPSCLPFNRSFEDSKKDNLIKLASNAFIILDELDGISRKDLNALKALFSMDAIRIRLPYARREETVQRIANFIGSTNEESFLNDPTGSVRWLVFHVSAIDWAYSKKINVDDLWSQAYALAKDVNFDESFTKEDVKNNEIRNETYQLRSPEAEMISLLYEHPNDDNFTDVSFLTSTEILIQIKAHSSLNRLSSISIGKAMKLLKFKRIKKNGIYGYNVVRTRKSLWVE